MLCVFCHSEEKISSNQDGNKVHAVHKWSFPMKHFVGQNGAK